MPARTRWALTHLHIAIPAGGSRRHWPRRAALAEATTDSADSDHQPDKSEDTREEAPSAGVQAPASVWLPFKTASEKKVGKGG
jgi:hypothetical protein